MLGRIAHRARFLMLILLAGTVANPNVTAATTFSGVISTHVSWAGEVNLTGDVTIVEGGELVIAAGSQVSCLAGRDDTGGGKSSTHTEIILNGGRLVAVGTPQAPVVFTSSADVPNPGDWYGVEVRKGNVQLADFVIEYATKGLQLTDTDLRSSTYALSDGVIQHSLQEGILWQPPGTLQPAVITLDRIQVVNNQGTGISQYGGQQLVLKNCLVSTNAGDGIYSYNSTLAVENSQIGQNSHHGIEATDTDITVTGCQVEQNQWWGISIYYYYAVAIGECVVRNNGRGDAYGGIVVGLARTADAPLEIAGSTISDQANMGIYLSDGWANIKLGAGAISGNVVSSNKFGFYFDGGSVTKVLSLNGNDIVNNVVHLKNAGISAIMANGNYWGEPLTTALATGKTDLLDIYDSRDDREQGQALIKSWYPQSVAHGGGGTLQHWTYNISGISAYFSGEITNEVTWSGKVLVTGDVWIREGGKLTVQAGTQVLFDPLRDDQTGGKNSSLCEIIVAGGDLVVAGTPEQPVSFTVGFLRQEGAWYGVEARKGNVRLTNFVIEYATKGLQLTDTDLRSSTYALSDGVIQHSLQEGILWQPPGTLQPAVITLDRIQVVNNQGTGISQYGGQQLVLKNCLVSTNAGDGIYSYNSTLAVENSQISQNSHHGIEATDTDITVTGCQVEQNQWWGISIYYYYAVAIGECVVRNNGRGDAYGGIVVGLARTADAPLELAGSTISDQANMGIYLSDGWANIKLGAGAISGNVVSSNKFGFYFDGGSVTKVLSLNGNDIVNNVVHLKNAGISAIMANGNYWGEPLTTALATGKTDLLDIYDSRDDREQGQALIKSWYPQSVAHGGGGTLQHWTYNISGISAYFSGEITNEVTWSGKVLVTGDVWIREGGKLTVQAGTQVLFDPLRDDQTGGKNSSLCEIIVAGGDLVVAGTPEQPVSFTVGFLRQEGAWYGVEARKGNVRLTNFVIEYATKGLQLTDTDLRSSTYALSDGVIQHSLQEGILWQPPGTLQPAVITLDRIQVVNNQGTGISQYGGQQLVLKNCLVSTNAGDGIYSYNSTLAVENSQISQNSHHGIEATDTDITVTGCQVEQNQWWGISIYYYYAVAIGECVVRNNGRGDAYGGIVVGLARTADAPLELAGSTISDQANMGIYLSDGWANMKLGAGAIAGNVIRVNKSGIVFDGGSSTKVLSLSGNDIVNNDMEIQNNGTSAIMANGNFWGEPTTTELNQGKVNLTRIHDRLDDASKGQVNIAQWNAVGISKAPKITLDLMSQSAIPGTNVTFAVETTGTLPLVYQWYKDGLIINGAVGPRLFLTGVKTNAAGAYQVIVTNFIGSVASRTAILSFGVLASPPEIAGQPKSANVIAGSEVTLRVVATGTSPLSYQWKRNGVNIPDGTTDTLVLRQITAAQAGAYTVTVSNAFGKAASDVAQVSLLDLDMFAGVIISGQVGNVYQLEYRDALDPNASWQLWKTVVLSENPQVFIDLNSPRQVKRFYRSSLQE